MPTVKKAAYLTLTVSFLLLLLKFWAYSITGSTAILSDALESIVNVITGAVALITVYISSRPPDNEHPYGHGKAEYFSAGLEGILITVAGLFIGWETLWAFINKTEINAITDGIYLISAAGLINAVLGFYLIYIGKKHHSPAIQSNGSHLLTDAYTSAGVILGLFLVSMFNIWWADPLVAGLIGIQISWQGYKIITDSFSHLMDKADGDIEREVASILYQNRNENWIVPHKMRSWKSGNRLFIDFHLIMPFYLTLEEAHIEEHRIHDLLRGCLNYKVDVMVHTEPCNTDFCFLCRKSSCKFRTKAFSKEIDWSAEGLKKRTIDGID